MTTTERLERAAQKNGLRAGMRRDKATKSFRATTASMIALGWLHATPAGFDQAAWDAEVTR